MHDGTSDPNNLATQSYSGAAEQSKQYKTYVKRLKKGKSNGISHILGSAAELLSNENLKDYVPHIQKDGTISSMRELLQNELSSS